jgi:hypothetical protein
LIVDRVAVVNLASSDPEVVQSKGKVKDSSAMFLPNFGEEFISVPRGFGGFGLSYKLIHTFRHVHSRYPALTIIDALIYTASQWKEHLAAEPK